MSVKEFQTKLEAEARARESLQMRVAHAREILQNMEMDLHKADGRVAMLMEQLQEKQQQEKAAQQQPTKKSKV